MSEKNYRPDDDVSDEEIDAGEAEEYYDDDDDVFGSGDDEQRGGYDDGDGDDDRYDDDDYDDRRDDRSERRKPRRSEEDAQRRSRARDAGRQFRSRMAEFEDDDDGDEKGPLLSAWVKGIIGILVSLTLVFVIIMLFAKVLFLHEPNVEVKTGTMTAVENTGTTFMTTTNSDHQTAATKTTKEKIRFNVEVTQTDKEGNKVTNTDEPVSKIKCISPVLVHPEPNSRSANLTTVPLNAEVDFIRNDNGWYYITYNGITGYAWGQFFTAPTTPTPH